MQGTASPATKVLRAKVHFDALEEEIRRFNESQPYQLLCYDDFQTSQYVVELRFNIPEIWPIGPILGDFVSCLRSALDHLVYGLVVMYGGTPTLQTGFPIIPIFIQGDSLAKLNQATAGLPADAVTIIESLQPYNAGSSFKLSHLYRLHTLWNIDKHRHIPLHSGGLELNFPRLDMGIPHIEETRDDCSIMRFPLVRKPDVHLDPHTVTTIVQFGSNEVGLMLSTTDLLEMYKFIGENVIPRFARFYK